MAICQSVLGLNLVCSRPLPRLATGRIPGAESWDVSLECAALAPVPVAGSDRWRLICQSADGAGEEPAVRIWRHPGENAFRFRYRWGEAGLAEFVVERKVRRIRARWAEPATLEDAATYLLGPILGFVLRTHGVVTLHASAVVIDGQAVALAGAARSGKSTTAAAFAQRGFPVLTDDITALVRDGEDFRVQADCPVLRLWPESSRWLGTAALPRLTPGWDKRFLDLDRHGYRAERRSRPLAAVYLLGGEALASAASSRQLDRQPAFTALLAHSYTKLILDRRMLGQEFDLFSRVAEMIPVRRLHDSEPRLTPAELCDFLAEDFRRRHASASPAVATRRAS